MILPFFENHSISQFFVHAKITFMYVFMPILYIIVAFMNAHNLHFPLCTFLSSFLTYFDKMIHNSLSCVLNYYVNAEILYSYINNKSKVNSLSTLHKKKAASGLKKANDVL